MIFTSTGVVELTVTGGREAILMRQIMYHSDLYYAYKKGPSRAIKFIPFPFHRSANTLQLLKGIITKFQFLILIQVLKQFY